MKGKGGKLLGICLIVFLSGCEQFVSGFLVHSYRTKPAFVSLEQNLNRAR